ERGRGWAVISAGRGRFLGRHIDGLAELVRRLGVGGHFEPFRLRSAEPLWTAFFPLLSLRTTYWGSSGDAATVRPASSRRSVTFSSTRPSAVEPWLRQATSSPTAGSSSLSPPMGSPVPAAVSP